MNITYEYESDFVHIPNSFIENYMGKANPTYICVYILTLKYISSNERFSTGMVAEKLDIMESDVIKAYEYWNDNKEIEFEKENKGFRIHILTKSEVDNIKGHIKPEYTAKQISYFIKNDENIASLLEMGERMFGQAFDLRWKNVIIRLYKYYKLSSEVIVVLFEYCIQNDKKKPQYIENAAVDWSNHNIETPEQANEYLRNFLAQKNCKKVISFFNAKPSTLLDDDAKAMIDKWYNVYKFSDEIIRMACQKTVKNINEMRISYADSILDDWYKKGIKTLQEAQQDSEKFAEGNKNKNKKAYTSRANTVKVKASSFSNFEQRSYDDIDLEAFENEIINEYSKEG